MEFGCGLPIHGGKQHPHEKIMWVDDFFKADCEAAEDRLRRMSEQHTSRAHEKESNAPSSTHTARTSFTTTSAPKTPNSANSSPAPPAGQKRTAAFTTTATAPASAPQTPVSPSVGVAGHHSTHSQGAVPRGQFPPAAKRTVENTEVSSSEDSSASSSCGDDEDDSPARAASGASLRSLRTQKSNASRRSPVLRAASMGRREGLADRDDATTDKEHSGRDLADMQRVGSAVLSVSGSGAGPRVRPQRYHDVRELCVECEVIKATDLGMAGQAAKASKLNPFCEVKLRTVDPETGAIGSKHDNPQKATTRAIGNTPSPVWKEVFWFNIPAADCLRVSVFSKKTLGTKAFLGHINITATQLLDVLSPGGPPLIASYPCMPDAAHAKRADVSGSVELSLRLVCLKQ